jgi:hypothetical protein
MIWVEEENIGKTPGQGHNINYDVTERFQGLLNFDKRPMGQIALPSHLGRYLCISFSFVAITHNFM